MSARDKLPKLHRAKLDASAVEAHLAELAEGATILQVRLKGGATARSQDGEIDLAAAKTALIEGAVSGVQISYRRSDGLWIDTLMTEGMPPGGARLVRMRMPTPAPDGSPPS